MKEVLKKIKGILPGFTYVQILWLWVTGRLLLVSLTPNNKILSIALGKNSKEMFGRKTLSIEYLYIDNIALKEYSLEAFLLKQLRTLEAKYLRKGCEYIIVKEEDIHLTLSHKRKVIENLLINAEFSRSTYLKFSLFKIDKIIIFIRKL